MRGLGDWLDYSFGYPFGYQKKTSLLGIHIGSTTIMLIEMSQKRDQYILESYGSVDYSMNHSLTETLSCLLKFAETTCRSVVIALSEPSIITRRIPWDDNQKLEDIDDQIELIFDQVIPFPLQESYYDYLIEFSEALGYSSKNKKANHTKTVLHHRKEIVNRPKKILIAASPRHEIEEWVDRMAFLGLKLRMVTESSLSMQRALNFMGEPMKASSSLAESRDIIALLDLGKTITTLYLLKKNGLFLKRELISCPEVLTEEMKDLLCNQIKMVLQDLLPGTERVLLEHLFVAGETLMINQLKGFIEKTLEISITMADPLAKVLLSRKLKEVDRQKIKDRTSELLPCFGLLLSAFDTQQKIESTRKINLLPWRAELRKINNKTFFLCLGFLVTLGLCCVGALQYYLDYQIKQEEAKIICLSQEKNNVSIQINKIKKTQQDKQDIVNRLKMIQALQPDREKWLRFFDVLPRLLPEAIYLQDVSVKNEIIFLEGNAGTHSAVATLLKTLAEHTGPCFFKDIKLNEITLDKHEPGFKFNLQLRLDLIQTPIGN